MKQFGEGSLRKLAMDAPTESIFHFEGEDYKEKRKVRRVRELVKGLTTLTIREENLGIAGEKS